MYKYSKTPPDNKKESSQVKYNIAIEEVEEYICNYEHIYGVFQYCKPKTRLEDSYSSGLKSQNKRVIDFKLILLHYISYFLKSCLVTKTI